MSWRGSSRGSSRGRRWRSCSIARVTPDRTITARGRHPGGHSYGAVFAEVRVSRLTGETRVSRLVGAIDCGRVLNHKTARSQAIGGMIWGLGFALTEHTICDRALGRILTPNLSGYLVPVEADVPDIDVIFIDGPIPAAAASAPAAWAR